MGDKRISPRFKWQGRVKIYDVGVNKLLTSDARMENFSHSGFALVVDVPLHRGKKYRFVINAFSMNLDLEARVVHLRTDHVMSTAGVRIDGLAFFERCRINRFIGAQYPEIQTRYFLYSLLAGAVGWGVESLFLGASGLVGMVSFCIISAFLYFLPPY